MQCSTHFVYFCNYFSSQAWRSLCNTQVACKSYLRPGLSAKVKDCDRGHATTYGGGTYNINKMATLPGNRMLSQESTHQPSENGPMENNSIHQSAGIDSSTRIYQSNHVVQADIMRATNRYNFLRTDAELHQPSPVADSMCANLDAMDDDDDILAVGPFIS